MQQATVTNRRTTTAELAQYLGVCEATVRRLAHSGTIPSRRVGRQLRFSIAEVENSLGKGVLEESA